jgi:hypothetical protein
LGDATRVPSSPRSSRKTGWAALLRATDPSPTRTTKKVVGVGLIPPLPLDALVLAALELLAAELLAAEVLAAELAALLAAELLATELLTALEALGAPPTPTELDAIPPSPVELDAMPPVPMELEVIPPAPTELALLATLAIDVFPPIDPPADVMLGDPAPDPRSPPDPPGFVAD